MKKKQRYVRITAAVVGQVGAGFLSYQEFCVLTYMLIFCGLKTDGTRNPYKMGRQGIAATFQVSDSRVKQILSALEDKGFIAPLYRLVKPDDTYRETTSLRRARRMLLREHGSFLRTYYVVRKFPLKKPVD